MSERVTIGVDRCPRCGVSHVMVFTRLSFLLLGHTHFAMCPVTWEPVLACVDGPTPHFEVARC